MEALNALRHVEMRTLERLRATPVPTPYARPELGRTLSDVAQVSASARETPVTRAVRDVVTNVQTYAATLVSFPSAATAAMLQAVADVNHLARLGQRPQVTSDDARTAARAMLYDSRDRAKRASDPNDQTAVISQGLQDAQRTLGLVGDRAGADLVPRFIELSCAQKSPLNRAMVLAAGAKVLAGVLSIRPQVTEHTAVHQAIPGAAMGLSPQRRSQFHDLWSRFENVSVRINRRYENETFSVQDCLSWLAQTGTLDQRDNHGDDLLANLHQLMTQPLAPGIDRDLVLAQTIAHVARPGRSMSQGTKLTCAAATVSYQMARRRPAEYARLVCGLTWPEGQVRTAGGEIARRIPGSLQEDGSGRSVVERIVQSALMQVGGSAVPAQYDAMADGFYNGMQQLVQTGMFPAQFAHLEQAVGEGRYQVVEKPSRELLLENMRTGADVSPVVLKWDGGEDHWVLARGVDHGRVYFRNPHGHRSTDKVTLAGVDHQLHHDGIESLPIEAFVGRAKTLLLRTTP